MRRHFLRATGVAAAVALALSACAGASGSESGSHAGASGPETGPVTITMTWWGNDDRAGRYKQALALFNKKYPNITVQTSFADYPSYWNARATEAAGRALPDVMQLDLPYLREYAANGHLLDLSGYVGDHTIDLSGFDKSLVGSGKIDGKQVAVPVGTNTLALLYNPNVPAQTGINPPAENYTWKDYNTLLAAVIDAGQKKADGHAIFGGVDYVQTTLWLFEQWFLQEGKTPFRDDGSFGFTQKDMKQFLNLTADLRKNDTLYPVERNVQLVPLSGFKVNESAADLTWDVLLAGYVADSGTANLTMMPIPSGSDGKKHMFFKPSMLLSAGANTKHPQAAAELIDFLLTDPEVGAIFGTSRGVPADKGQRDAMKVEKGSVDATVVAYEKAVSGYVTEPVPVRIKGFSSLEATYIRLGQDLAYGKITVDEFVN